MTSHSRSGSRNVLSEENPSTPTQEHTPYDSYSNSPFQNASPRRDLPADLPRNLDDRRTVPAFQAETEMYDAWQEQSQFLTAPVQSQPLTFSISLSDTSEHGFGDPDESDLGTAFSPTTTSFRPSTFTAGGDDVTEDSDGRLVRMLASQARLRGEANSSETEDQIVNDPELTERERGKILQDLLAMAASNGENDRLKRLLGGPARKFLDMDMPDADGNVPIIYASCFGHLDCVKQLVGAGASLDRRDLGSWTGLMWAITNRHKEIAKFLLDNGASQEIRTSSGRTAFDFVVPNSDMGRYLAQAGYKVGNGTGGMGEDGSFGDDFYNAGGGFGQERFEEEMVENEMRRRMMMESAINLEVDLGNLTLDEQAESPIDDFEDNQEFIWDRCLNDQMFVFQEQDLDKILTVVITHMTPSRSPSQKPVPANLLFLAARYAHYHASSEFLEVLLSKAFAKINAVVEVHQWDMTMLAFWISNATLLLHYLKKDAGLVDATVKYQSILSDLVQEIFILIIRDAERRMDRTLDKAILEYESIPGFEDVTFQNEWKIFRSRNKKKETEVPPEKRFRPPSPKRKAQIAPRNVTSLLSSTLFVLELYDVHSVILVQVISQLFYWLGCEIFNRILDSRKYLARTKAMQIKMNISALEDWALQNNRRPEHYEHGETTTSGESAGDAARRHLAPVQQLLQWLQVLSGIGEDFEALIGTLQQLPRLNAQQLIHSAKYYRAEVGEASGLSKSAMKYLSSLREEMERRREGERKTRASLLSSQQNQPGSRPQSSGNGGPNTPVKNNNNSLSTATSPNNQAGGNSPGFDGDSSQITLDDEDQEPDPENLFLDPAHTLPFSLPTSTDMLVSYGAGFGGKNRERERKYIPSVPPEFLERLNFGGVSGKKYEEDDDGKEVE